MARKKDRHRDREKERGVKPGKIEGLQAFCERHHLPLLFCILAAAFILRLLALSSLKGTIYFDYLMYDERLYHEWAKALAEGTFQSSSVYEMAPLPAYFMAMIYWLLSPDIMLVRVSNIIFDLLTCWLVYLLGRDLSNRTTGLIACLIAALYKPFIFYSIVPLNTSMSVFFFALTCWLLVAFVKKASLTRAFFLGVAICLAYNVRPNCLLLIPAMMLIIMWDAFRNKYPLKTFVVAMLLYASGVAAVEAPFMIRNYMKAGEASAVPSQSGLNLYICNDLEYGFPVPFASTVPSEMGIQFTIEASRRTGKRLSSGEASKYWTDEVIRMALDRPAAFTGKQVRKLLGVFNRFDYGDHYQVGFISDFARFFKFPFPDLWLILPFGMTGMCLAMFRDRKSFALAGVFIVYAATLVVFFSHTRVRMPIMIILIPFAVTGLEKLYSHIKNKEPKKKLIYAGILALFFVIEFLPVRDTKDTTAYLNTHANILKSKGLTGEALKYLEESSRLEKHYSDFANLSLAGLYYNKGEKDRAFSYLNRISDKSYAASYKYELTGDIMAKERQYDKAVTAYERALDINSGMRLTRRKLIDVLLKVDRGKVQEQYEKLIYINSFYNLYNTKEKEGND